MMKIKEMQKLYKKVNKANEMYEEAELVIRLTDISCLDETLIDRINSLRKAANIVKKIAESLDVKVGELTSHIDTEESFCYWCMMNNLELKSSETEEETEEENED